MTQESLYTIGWREWVALPSLGIERIKAKIDTGARTSALHAFFIEPFEEHGIKRVRFEIHPLQHNTQKVKACIADIIDVRWVTDSGGHREERYVIETIIQLAGMNWPIEITLTNRDIMTFRMLLGRTALRERFLVNSSASFLAKKKVVK